VVVHRHIDGGGGCGFKASLRLCLNQVVVVKGNRTGPSSGDPDGGAGSPRRRRSATRQGRARQRERQLFLWRQRALQARARIDDAKRAIDAACGPGVLVLTGG